jgi:hypothetical protein
MIFTLRTNTSNTSKRTYIIYDAIWSLSSTDLQFQLDVQRLQLEEVTKKYAAELDWKERAQRDFENTTQKAGDVSVRCQSYSEQNAALKGQLSIAEQSVANMEKVGCTKRGAWCKLACIQRCSSRVCICSMPLSYKLLLLLTFIFDSFYCSHFRSALPSRRR